MPITPRLQLPPERPGHPAPPEILATREGMAKGIAAGVFKTDPSAQEVTIGGVRTLRFAPPGESAGTVLQFHGGAFRIGCPEISSAFAAALVKRCNVTVLCPNYRLAPEHPFPAGIADGRSVLQNLPAHDRQKLIISGDSAGGGLAAALTALSLADPVPSIGLMIFSAWLDLTVSSAAYKKNAATDPLFSENSATTAAKLYLQGESPENPLASPLFADLSGFPPSFVSAGSGEVLVEDSQRFAEKLRLAGIPVQLDVFPGMEHVAVTRGMHLTGAPETFEAAVNFINERLAAT